MNTTGIDGWGLSKEAETPSAGELRRCPSQPKTAYEPDEAGTSTFNDQRRGPAVHPDRLKHMSPNARRGVATGPARAMNGAGLGQEPQADYDTKQIVSTSGSLNSPCLCSG